MLFPSSYLAGTGTLIFTTRYWDSHQFNAFSLAEVFRAKFLATVRQSHFKVPDSMPNKWVVDCQYVGSGLPAIKYLSRYLYRGVIAEKNIISDDGVNVTFQYRESKTGHGKPVAKKANCLFGWFFSMCYLRVFGA